MNKVYSRIGWKNYPNTSTAINETNLNRMDKAIDDLDNRVIEQDSTKANQTTVNNMVKNWTMDETTGVITVEKQDGSTIMFDLNIEKIPVTFELSPSGILTMTTSDGTQFTANIGSMIPVLTFNESDQIAVSVIGSGLNKTYSFTVKDGSITEGKLQPNYLANIKTEVAKAQSSEGNAQTYSKLAQSYAVGSGGAREDEATDNAKYYYEQAKQTDIGQISSKVYEINSKLSEQLGNHTVKSDVPENAVFTDTVYDETDVKEEINEINRNLVELQGNVDFMNKELPLSKTTQGTNPTIQDSTKAPLIYGKFAGYTDQKTMSGKNLLNATLETTKQNGVTCTANGDGTYTLNGTAKTNIFFQVGKMTLKAGKTYKNVSTPKGGGSGIYSAYFAINGESYTYDYGEGKVFSFDSDKTNASFVICINTGVVCNNLVFKPMVTTDIEATYDDFEPYFGGIPSPNPDYPQDIQGLGDSGSIEVKTTGKNIFGGLALANALVNSGSTNVVVDESAGTVTFSYNTNYKDESKFILFSDFKENTQYTAIFKGNIKKNDTSAEYRTNVSFYYTDGTYTTINPKTDGDFNIAIVSEAGKSVMYIKYGYANNDITKLYYDQCGVFEGVITEAEFEPYTETNANLPITSPLYDGDYIEVYADGSGKIVRKMKKMVLDGSTNALNGTDGFLENGYNYAYLFLNRSLQAHLTSKSSIGVGKNLIESLIEGISLSPFNKSVSLVLSDERSGALSTDTKEERIAKFNTWLQSNPVTVVYELATSTEEPLTAEQVQAFKQLYTFDNVTNVICDGETTIRYYVNNDCGDTVGMLQEQITNIKNDLDKLNSLPKGSIIQIEADKDDIETTTQKYGWQYLGTSNIQYDNGSSILLETNVYRKNN